MARTDSAFLAIVRGRVQGVLYRDFVATYASEFDLTGSARNLEDGTVEIIAEGDEKHLHTLLAHLKKGPELAEVEDITVEWMEPSGQYDGFSIR